MKHYAYIRVSTKEQNTDRQLDTSTVKFDKVYEDKCSGKDTHRAALDELRLDANRGDTIHVHSFDRLSRNMLDLLGLVKWFTEEKGVSIKFYKPELTFSGDKDSHIDKLILNIMSAVSEFERSMISDRQAEGIAKAKERGVYKGAKRKADHTKVRNMVAEGIPKAQVARKLGLSRQTVYDILNNKS